MPWSKFIQNTRFAIVVFVIPEFKVWSWRPGVPKSPELVPRFWRLDVPRPHYFVARSLRLGVSRPPDLPICFGCAQTTGSGDVVLASLCAHTTGRVVMVSAVWHRKGHGAGWNFMVL